MLRTPVNEGGQKKLLLPVRLSSDFRRMLVLQTLISIMPSLEIQSIPKSLRNKFKYYNIQNLDMSADFLSAKNIETAFSPDVQISRDLHRSDVS
jgi:hypothetical protein